MINALLYLNNLFPCLCNMLKELIAIYLLNSVGKLGF